MATEHARHDRYAHLYPWSVALLVVLERREEMIQWWEEHWVRLVHLVHPDVEILARPDVYTVISS